MADVFDFITNNGNISIKNGDLELGESTKQHIKCLLLAEKGTYKQSPTIGLGIRSYLLDDKNGYEFRRDVQNELENDGMIINSITGNFDNLKIDANYA